MVNLTNSINSIDKTTSQIKSDVMNILINNKKIVELIDNKDVELPEELINKNILSRLKVDYTVDEVGTYIGIKIDYPSITDNNNYKNYVLTFMIVSHNKHINTDVGINRNDALSEELIKIFNFNYDIGFGLELKSDVEDPLNVNYYYRKLMFKSITLNGVNNKWIL